VSDLARSSFTVNKFSIFQENELKPIEERRATLAAQGISQKSSLLASKAISVLVVVPHSENLRKYVYSYL
jgi:hypothetical protein